MSYDHKAIEEKQQQRWAEAKIFEAQESSSKPKQYILVEFPYPSGAGLHVGHCRSYTALDIVARKSRMEGKNVLFPIGFDAFGLPTENYAIKHKIHPRKATDDNIANFTRQLQSVGFSFDWSRTVDTTEPDYYRWTQWIFLQLLEKGLAYQAEIPINWCPKCKIGLANEEVVAGNCERCGAKTERRKKKQWMLAITKYAQRLYDDLATVDFLPKIRAQQENWIGPSTGSTIRFAICDVPFTIEVFTTRSDTLFGCTYVVLAPEHSLIENLKSKIENWSAVETYITASAKKSDLERTELTKEKTGVQLQGVQAINPVNGESVPVYIADYVLAGYGTGAVMAVPAHDERDFAFAKKFNLPIKTVVQSKIANQTSEINTAFTDDGILTDSAEFTGLTSAEARSKITAKLETEGKGRATVNFKLRDWVFSRQRYWGEPIPVVHCAACGVVPLPASALPLTLPHVDSYEPTDNGDSPLAAITDWVNTECPKCGGKATRETDTMPNWAGSSWYFLRYTDPQNSEALASKEALAYWTPVDLYNGGMEHTVLHLLYSRFWHKFLYDLGLVPTSEPYQKRVSHGMILGPDGEKMSKSRGNVINPDEVIKSYGADTLRVYEMFIGPFDQAVTWSESGVEGARRFLERVYRLFDRPLEKKPADGCPLSATPEFRRALHKTIKKVTEDIEGMHFNTAVSQMMIFINFCYEQKALPQPGMEKFLKIFSVFAPHLAEELWAKLGHETLIASESWPAWSPSFVVDDEITIVFQVNGKIRDEARVAATIDKDAAIQLAKQNEKVQKWMEGKPIVKEIFVPGKLVNIVVQG